LILQELLSSDKRTQSPDRGGVDTWCSHSCYI